MYQIYMKNNYTYNTIFIKEFEHEHDAYVFIINKNTDPMFEYYVRKK